MVSQDSQAHPTSSSTQQFSDLDPTSSQNHFHYSTYGSEFKGINIFSESLGALPNVQSLKDRMSRPMNFVQASSMEEQTEVGHTRHLMDLLGATDETNNQTQRLSLSLGSHLLVPQVQCRQRPLNSELTVPGYLISGEQTREACNIGVEEVNTDYSFSSNAFRSSTTLHEAESFAMVIRNSRYLKPAQILLAEIVNISEKTVDISNEKFADKFIHGSRRGALGLSSQLKADLYSNDLLTADKQAVQVKIVKLVALLEEVEDRFEKYYHQMEQVILSFEEVAGSGAAKSYTGLALQAMSRHFSSLRDAIVSQIITARRKLSQDLPRINRGLSQLNLFDVDNTRQTRLCLQQLGIITGQRQAWRPIRGLPETSVAILRSWLFEHFLHPYPNDSEKLMLASQTGLTKNQVSNWFINARVRLWKPMIEEMYKEEFADYSEDSNPAGPVTREGATDQSED
ncbi:hypothetical protein K2173_027963 [Erythroxylum novogranatense]|uniref:Homeobox domain-containing protein n=1 Tax=Erythroxylum novogranatense TaxID=1862640 RepID=A0AAV8U1U4_9ROSI|nr:hypothetical protein K2173_027963 [Erythroxylum novogranatense]